jgi:hypothetical protein
VVGSDQSLLRQTTRGLNGHDVQVTGWTVVDGPATQASESISVAEFVTLLSKQRGRLVPFVGAGLAAEAGAPSSNVLLDKLAEAAGVAAPRPIDFFARIDWLGATHGEDWVRQRVADIVGTAVLRPTPALMALSKTARGLIVTTNYDDAIEISARAAGRQVVSATLDDFRPVLEPPVDTLVVLHLHGLADDADSIVVTEDSYQRVLQSDVAQLLLRAVGVAGRLMFLGHALADREEHIHRDLAWTARAGVPRGEQRHLLIRSVPDAGDPAVASEAEALAERGVQVFVFHDPQRTYGAVRVAAAVTAGRSAVQDEYLAEALGDLDAHYVPHSVAAAEDLVDDSARGAYLARTWQHGEQMAPDLDVTESRLLLIGAGGYGKSRELREIAGRADRPALYLRLGGTAPPFAGAPADATFIRWMDKAAAAAGNPSPRLTLARLREESFVLLLDSLDEVPADLRHAVISVISEVVEAHPQHRWVVASRPVAAIDDLAGFAAYTFAPDSDWIYRYAERRSVDSAAVNVFLAGAPGVRDLMDIPVYAISVVDELAGGRQPPKTALALILQLADARVAVDQRALADPQVIRRWLDRVALAFELQGVTEASLTSLAAGALHRDLDIAPTAELLDDLAVRALVTDTAGIVRFPANIVQEARAARAVLTAGERGQQLLRAHVLVRLPETEGTAAAVTGVRQSWLNTLTLLLGAADASWRELVAAYDPMLAARATPNEATEAERHEAIGTMWNTYLQRRVWLTRGTSGDQTDDAGALRRLLAASAPDGFIRDLLDALNAADRTARANALLVLPAALPDDELHPLVAQAVTDPDPVLRRQATAIAWERGFTDLAEHLARQAVADDDELARQTLSDFAIALAPSNEVAIELARAVLPAAGAERVWREVAQRVPRAELLELVPGPPVDAVLLDVLLDDGAVHRTPWTVQEVCRLSETLTRLPDDLAHLNGIERVLGSHPLAALAGRLTGPAGESWWWDIGRLIERLDPESLGQVHTLLLDAQALTAAAGVELTAPVDPETVERARDLLTRRMQPPVDPTPRPSTPGGERRRQRLLAAASGDLDAADLEFLLGQPRTSLSADLDQQQQARLDARVADEISELVRGGELQALAAERNPHVPVLTMRALLRAAEQVLPLSGCDWAAVALFALRWSDERLSRWCRDTAPPTAVDDLLELLDGDDPQLRVAAQRVFAPPSPERLIHVVLDAALELGRSDDGAHESLATGAIFALLDAGAAEVVRARMPTPTPTWLRSLAVQLGDCDAERTLLQELLADPGSIPRWPLGRATSWLSSVRYPSSADLLHDVLRDALRAGREAHELNELFRALERTAGQEVLRRYDTLINDPAIPSAPFLHYQRQKALDALIESHGQATVTDVNLTVVALCATAVVRRR